MGKTTGTESIHRPWWRSWRLIWVVIVAAALASLAAVVVEKTSQQAPIAYSAFLDQLDAGNVAGVTFQGSEIDGRFKHPLDNAPSDTFRSRVPDIGDPALIAELRKQHIVIDVGSPSQWTRLLAGLPWPMLFFVGMALVSGLVRLIRGGKPSSASTTPMHPMQGMIGLASGLFAKKDASAGPSTRDSEPKHG
ncbi:MAG: ATP-dependent metallopeptidase FtsH/Yme1/Tma family protein [Alphaproteobacteria bacterium]|nr:ATP-dependent metallopeptidase FtsH/Yme1/Tma family protein [Alphaproteobacteria bacterium]